ncbi:glycosyltransferase family 9 protein [Hymenobacter sp. PAMC 26628]|uniref:glycosyltransferase family 9 protein n=1 Tax=Hymenobacter sp. PAMC 26628 TaxID=1484118 RepID=UPI000A9BB143|nr:glycosyltransferase family 9 protein [Hymenobacter sp. PAMC 26628]
MLSNLIGRFRQYRRQRRQGGQVTALSQADATALAAQAPPDPARVLVVRNDSIGDYLLYRPWLRQLSAAVRGRGQRLTLVANALWAPLARAWDADAFDELVVVDFGRFTKDLAYRAETLGALGAQGFGEVVYPLHVREPAVENFIRFLGAPVRVASQSGQQGPWVELINAGYTRLMPSTLRVLFEYDRNREFFENWQRGATEADAPLVLVPGATAAVPLRLPAAVHQAADIAAAAGPYIVLFPGASARQKRWPTGHFAQLAQGLHRHFGARYRLVTAGSAADDAYARRIMRAAGPGVPFDNRCGQTDLPALAALVAGAQLLISNDTVTAHLGAQAGVPLLVLLMGENYGKFFPYPAALLGAPCRCLFPPSQEARFAQGDFSPPVRDPRIDQITPARALAAAIELLPKV